MKDLDLLIHVKANKEWTESIDVGLRLARHLDARVHGLMTLGDLARTRALFAKDANIISERQAFWERKSAEAELRFREALKKEAVDGTWQIGEGQASELLTLVGRVHDMIVVEQNDPGIDEIDWDPAEETAVGSGVPTLIVPKAGRFPVVGRRIAIAWNHSRESARAVQGALPLLRIAQSVVVIAGQRKEAFSSIVKAPPHDLAASLRRKGMTVDEVLFDPVSAERADAALLAAVENSGADLLIMGAYGRSWLREWFLGGATRHVLRHMAVPVLMAH
jgi:nucleotide-binding universal stress UspA family protein